MLGPIGSEIMRIFRLLTPEEIDKYIVREGEAKVARPQKMASGSDFNLDNRANTPNEKKTLKQKSSADLENNVLEFNSSASFEDPPEGNEHNESEISIESRKLKTVRSSSNSALESAGILSASRMKELEQKRLKEENEKKDSTTVFLIKERLKARKAKQLLTESYAISLYEKNSNQDFNQDIEIDEDGNRVIDPMKGILLNKKQY